jgi:hypothetical protein
MTNQQVSLISCNPLLVHQLSPHFQQPQQPRSVSSNSIVHATIGISFYCLPLLILMSKIATIIILEHACLLYASSSRPSSTAALNTTHATYMTSNTPNELPIQFPASQEYVIPQVTDFILQHRLE